MKIPMTKAIETERCRLRIISRDDFPYTWSATRHKGFNDGMTWDPPNTIEELEAPFKRNVEAWENGTAYNFSIEDKATSEFIGRTSVEQEEDGNWSFGYWIHPDKQGNGYGKEAAAAIVDFAFSKLDIELITSAHATWNEASKRIIVGVGMKFVRINPEGFFKASKPVEELEYALTKKDWLAMKK